MNWEALGAIGEVVGAAGVIASLLYLALQVRSSTRASAVEAKLAATRIYADFMSNLIESPELNALFLRGRQDLGSLSPEEYIRFSNLAILAFAYFSAGYFQFRRGTLAEDDFLESRVVLQFWLRGAGCRQWWREVGRNMYGPGFVAFVEAEMAGQTPAAGGGR